MSHVHRTGSDFFFIFNYYYLVKNNNLGTLEESRNIQQQMSRHNSRLGFEISQELRLDNQQLELRNIWRHLEKLQDKCFLIFN